MHLFLLSRNHGPATLFCVAAWAAACSRPTDASGAGPAVLIVNQHEVCREEFHWFMQQERAGVFQHFKSRHNLEDGKGFWIQAIEGATPQAMLRSNTVARVTREKVEQILFQELGLVGKTDYETFLAQLEKLNRERADAARQGRPVYGPVRYTQLQFYAHWKATLREQATAILAQRRWPPSEESLRKFYDGNRAMFRMPSLSDLEVLTVQAQKKPGSGEVADAVRSAAGSLLAELRGGAALSDVLKEQPEREAVNISGQRLERISADRLGEVFPDEEQLQAVLALAPGESLLLADSKVQARIVRCRGKAAGDLRPYEAVQRQVRQGWLAQQYNQHIEHLVGQAKVQVNQRALDALSD